MKPIYKKVPILKPHCPICGAELLGNNSVVNPWQCGCGIWTAIPKDPWNGDYEILKTKQD